ncbi:hypothetical protein JHK87_042600 [Glycine soja]|nr:hypothetical protein JHK87_042600 [Glycine soja]
MPTSFCLVCTRTTPYWEKGLLSMIDPKNQYKTFQSVLFSLTCFPGNFSEDHSSHNYSKSRTLNYKVLK